MPESRRLSMHDIPDSERPRERLLTQGPGALSNAELLAILLRTGTSEENVLHLAERLLAQFGGLQELAEVSCSELLELKGLGSAKVAQMAAAFELGKRLITYEPHQRPTIHEAADAARLVADMRQLQQEHVRVILLDISRRVIAIPTVYIGTLNASVLRVSEIFREAVIRNSPALIMVHNHPSGDPAPSPEDIELTRTLIAAARLLDIMLVDHLIIGRHDWKSLRDMGLAFTP
jgi:DNA repair protein RadC